MAGTSKLSVLLEYLEGELFTLWIPGVGGSAPIREFALPWSAPSRISASRKEHPAAETASASLSLGQEGRTGIHWEYLEYDPAVSWQMLTPGQLQWVSTDHSLWAPTDSPSVFLTGCCSKCETGRELVVACLSGVLSGAKHSFDISPCLSQFPLKRQKVGFSIKRFLTGNYWNTGTDFSFSKLADLSEPRLQHFWNLLVRGMELAFS